MSKLRLSNSQINTYTDCNFKWYLDKVKKLRPNWKGSALIFGSALDNAVEHILLKKEGSPYDTFIDTLSKFDVNGTPKELPRDILDVRFFAGDIDINIITTSQMDIIGAYCDSIGIDMPEVDEFLLFCKQQRKNKTALSKPEQKLFNFLAYQTMLTKGAMLLEKLSEWIDENVVEVHSVQKKISIENENGDSFIGFLDFIVTMKNGKKVLIDLKTSSNPSSYYPQQSASESIQLGIYSQEECVPDVAYLVADKKIRVREPKVRLSFIEGIITEEHLDNIFGKIEKYTTEIKEKLEIGEEAFSKNLDSCVNFGGCEFFNYCKKGDIKGLCYVK